MRRFTYLRPFYAEVDYFSSGIGLETFVEIECERCLRNGPLVGGLSIFSEITGALGLGPRGTQYGHVK